ncbi:hypothetical protein [Marinoscillum sp. 108]|uniref:DUF7282 domain-containing protein n=1 Tax=Marinoscillum sp. 108 TaxID=2653151 RepID=UPI0012F438ED|nr:hypothetical protein [Marinoscillum sp. 108]VXD16720.1 conserved exported hypothetical protein [Marinoscillum sp. 108]
MRRTKRLFNHSSLLFLAGAFLFAGCGDDDTTDMEPEEQMPSGMLTVSSQTISQNTIRVSNVNFDSKGWVVVHASNEDGTPVVPGIISEPLLVEAGSQNDLELTLTEVDDLMDGDKLWVMLHTDDGIEGTYEFDGANGFDGPILSDGNIVMTDITVSAPGITASNQVVNENWVTIGEVKAAVDGWLVIHADNGSGAPGPVLGQTMVSAGMNSDVAIDLGDAVFAGGEMLFPMLHIESPADGMYGFPENGDDPEVFANDVVVIGIETLAPTGSISAVGQVVQGNMITASELTLNATGWVVVHASNATKDGPEVPGIISTPVQLPAGTNSDVAIELNSDFALSAGDVIYIMLHTENGVIGEYEFDGANGFDGPITTAPMTLEAPSGSFMASNQVVSQNTLMVESITVGQPSWVVVHRDNGAGSFVAPGIISNPVAIDAGTTENVAITFKDDEPLSDGETLWIMLHNESGTIGAYEFDGANGFDLPITFSSIDIEAPSVMVSDQIVMNNMVTIDEVKAGVDGWIVIHEDNGNGAPGPVLGQTFVNAGSTSDVMVDLGSATVAAGDKLFPMLHIESPADGEYGFPDNGDGPEVFNSDVVVVSFTAL